MKSEKHARCWLQALEEIPVANPSGAKAQGAVVDSTYGLKPVPFTEARTLHSANGSANPVSRGGVPRVLHSSGSGRGW